MRVSWANGYGSIRRRDPRADRIIALPLLLINGYIGLSLACFVVSPMFEEARNKYWSLAYGAVAMAVFSFGYLRAARGAAMRRERRANPPSVFLNALLCAMCVANLAYFVPMLRLSFNYYGFSAIADLISNLGQNYRDKGDLMEEIGLSALGPVYTLLNLAAVSQIAPYTLLLFSRDRLYGATVACIVASAGVTILYYLSIGTMSGIFYIVVLIGSGWFLRQYVYSVDDVNALRIASRRRITTVVIAAAASCLFFVLMVVILSSRLEKDMVVSLPYTYDYDSPVYAILGQRYGDGLGVALSYIATGWFGLGNSFDVEFQWTEGLSFSRVLTSYIERFSDGEAVLKPLSYPVRQEMMSGYPAFAYWHTIFPWLASDFTFLGALLVFGLMGAFYGRVWVTAIREGCLVSASLFGLLTIGALFINANSQILDNKTLTLGLLGLLALLPFRRRIGGIG